AAERDWAQRLPAASPEPVCGAALADFRGLLAAMQADYLPAIEAFSTAFGLAMRCGQLRRAIALATNLGFTYTRMSDFESAMDWLKRALDLARGARWPGMIGLCLAHTGEALRRLGQLDNARELLRECLQLSAGQPQARTAALACRFLAQTEMDSGDFAAGL
ncbi:tetratricopeptide repeat protein, partial [Paucibacter sp. XJ19-41]|uniref:tetratricopeptide repeat protein n=1 Tax=Paucibacter sp. XJ19-41 TaxID=2927824 RepID=UPI00234A7B24